MGLGEARGNLYAFGGYSSENYAVRGDVAILPILNNGQVGTPKLTDSRLPQQDGLQLGDGFGRSNLAFGGFLFIIGGEVASPNPNNTRLYTNRIAPDGSLQRVWTRSGQTNPVAGGVWNNAVAFIPGADGRILAFSIGGQTHPNSGSFIAQRTTNQVTVAAIHPHTGACDAWVQTDPLPVRKQAGQAVAIGNRIYVIGGTADDSSTDDRLHIGIVDVSKGRINWGYQPGSLPVAVAVPAATIYRVEKRVFLAVLGGSSTGDNHVWSLEIPAD
jgi:hypothetical protein